MRKILLGIAMLAVFATAEAADLAALRSYALRALPNCPNANLNIEPVTPGGPAGFQAYKLTHTSSDENCGGQQILLYSPTTDQTFLGRVVTLPADSRPIDARLTEYASTALKVPTTVKFAPLAFPDGVRQVLMTRQTPYGPFAFRGYVDASNKYLLMGWVGSLKEEPSKTIKRSLGLDAAVRRGNSMAKVEIIEISDFQCPSCARAHETLEPYLTKNLGKISYARLDLPLFEHHEWALSAAAAARAINKVAPTKYWSFVDTVFRNQESIGKRPFETFLKEFLEDNDIAWAKVQPAYNSKTDRAAILEQVSRLYAAGVNATPTFLINGRIVGFGDGRHAFETIRKTIEGK